MRGWSHGGGRLRGRLRTRRWRASRCEQGDREGGPSPERGSTTAMSRGGSPRRGRRLVEERDDRRRERRRAEDRVVRQAREDGETRLLTARTVPSAVSLAATE